MPTMNPNTALLQAMARMPKIISCTATTMAMIVMPNVFMLVAFQIPLSVIQFAE
jgi:hypothetical protein